MKVKVEVDDVEVIVLRWDFTSFFAGVFNPEVGSEVYFSGPQYTIPQLCFRSAINAITQCFQICQCAMRNAAIADTSATHNHRKESKRGRLVAVLVLLLTQVHITFKKKLFKIVCGTVAAISLLTEKRICFLCGESNVRNKPLEF